MEPEHARAMKFIRAIDRNEIQHVLLMLDDGYIPVVEDLYIAIRKNYSEIFHALLINNCQMTSECIRHAISYKRDEMVYALIAAGCLVTSSCLHAAIIADSVGPFYALLCAGCPINEVCMRSAVKYKRHEMLIMMRSVYYTV